MSSIADWIYRPSWPTRVRLAWRWSRVGRRAAQFGRGWRYATSRLTRDDALEMLWDSEQVAGLFSLESFDQESVLESATERCGEHAALPDLVARACRRVASKWNSDGETRGAAEDWALDLVAEYAAADGIELKDSWDFDGAEEAP